MSGRVGGGGGNGRTDFRSSPESSKTGYRFRLNGAADWVFFLWGGPVDGLQRLAESRPLTPRVLFFPVFFFFFFFFFFFSSCRSWKLRRWRKSRKYLPPPPKKTTAYLSVQKPQLYFIFTLVDFLSCFTVRIDSVPSGFGGLIGFYQMSVGFTGTYWIWLGFL